MMEIARPMEQLVEHNILWVNLQTLLLDAFVALRRMHRGDNAKSNFRNTISIIIDNLTRNHTDFLSAASTALADVIGDDDADIRARILLARPSLHYILVNVQ